MSSRPRAAATGRPAQSPARPTATGRKTASTPAASQVKAPPKTAYHHGDLARALVRSATALIQRGGPGALTLREAARQAGVSVAAPYRHFADREALLAAVLAEGFDGLADHTDRARRRAPDALAALRAVGLGYVEFAVANPSVYRLMFGPECDKQTHPDLMVAGQRAYGVLVQAVRDAQAAGLVQPGPAEVVALAGWSICHGLASLHADGLLEGRLPLTIDQAAQRLVDMLLAGAAAPAPPKRRR
ncbi:MAG TPA: TetR/AcrR family transcriptional regulator [Ideonella sp.]|uniref:TetR/AcrR family transcriptional regulator n=1 Tax=Ideonella sp. TaxID=1929293 RepID=UPI002E327ED7|nr:TetR/AcrR family transcriptional regulator [Ideonella sp.]HEX5685566.1 TetR/AcrR family transcriptional regulator [Ideonella sp.]